MCNHNLPICQKPACELHHVDVKCPVEEKECKNGFFGGAIETNESESCTDKYPNLKECWEIDYPYDGTDMNKARERAFKTMKKKYKNEELKMEKEVDANKGPCYKKGGKHTNVKIIRTNDYAGSIVCCPCCLDESKGPVTEAKCDIVYHE